MDMEMQPRGRNFKLTLNSQDIGRGLRPSKRVARNSGYLITCKGAVGKDGVLQVLDSMDSLDLSDVTDGFPYPQIFVLPSVIIVCGETKIYEWVANALVLKITVSAGATWDMISIADYVYISNGVVSIVRDPITREYAESDLPTASCICNFNGQVFIGAPGEDSST